MPSYARLLSLVLAFLFLLVFLMVVRRRSMKPFYSFLWLLVSLLMFSFVLLEKAYKWLATLIGLRDASFLVTNGLVFFLLVYILYLTVKVSEMSDRIQELISHSAILERKLRRQHGGDAGSTPPSVRVGEDETP
jgi:hypothetical protein